MRENAGGDGYQPTDYEVWRSGPNLKARDVRLYFGLTEQQARETLDLCYRDKAEAYPDAQIEFYVMHVTRTRVDPASSAGVGTEAGNE